jgi:hypothetical protein
VIRSTDPAASAAASAVQATRATPGALPAHAASCDVLGSVAITEPKWAASPRAAWPLPVAQSQARSRSGARAASSVNSAASYEGRKRA